jgi:hypothetical protein
LSILIVHHVHTIDVHAAVEMDVLADQLALHLRSDAERVDALSDPEESHECQYRQHPHVLGQCRLAAEPADLRVERSSVAAQR